MPCDICSNRDSESILPAKTMQSSVARGFNPFTAGLIPERLARLAHADSAEEWTQQTLNGLLAKSDWKLCKTCAAETRTSGCRRQGS